MTSIAITTEFLGDLGELYFKHLCQQRRFAYIRLERIHKTLPNPSLEFSYRYWRLPILIPKDAIEEVTRVAKPTLINESESFVFDFLTTKVSDADDLKYPNARKSADFCWVEIKTGASSLSRHQEDMARTCKIRFSIFRIRNVMSSPRRVEIDWEFDSLRRQRSSDT